MMKKYLAKITSLFLCAVFATIFSSFSAYAIDGGTSSSRDYTVGLIFAPIPGVNVFGLPCSGALIDPEWVLTSGDCSEYLQIAAGSANFGEYTAAQVKVVTGPFTSSDISNVPFDQPGAVAVSELIVHPDREVIVDIGPDVFYKINNVTLLRLATPITSVTPVQRYTGMDTFIGGQATSVGWTSEFVITPTVGDNYSHVELTIPLASTYNTEDCPNQAIPFLICGGLQLATPHLEFSDQGGPLIIEQEGEDFLIGTLDAPDGGFDLKLDVFTRVTSVNDFIDTTIDPGDPVDPPDPVEDDFCIPVKGSNNKVSLLCI